MDAMLSLNWGFALRASRRRRIIRIAMHNYIDRLEPRLLFAGDKGPYGIDVSHWDGTINWPSVFAAGKVFAWQKATEGVTYNDPTLATNMSGAKAAGVPIGAY